MNRQEFEREARKHYPEIDLTRTGSGHYRATKAADWWEGWCLAKGLDPEAL